MNRFAPFFISVIVFSAGPVTARSRAYRPVPLMPSRYEVGTLASNRATGSVPGDSATLTGETPRTLPRTGIGIEVGSITRPSGVSGDLLGMQMMFGGRVFLRIPLTQRLFLKPALGYFGRSNGTNATSVMQNSIDGGATVQYAFSVSPKTYWFIGSAQRLEAIVSAISAYDTTGTSAIALRYRMGPTIGTSVAVGRDLNFVADAEATFSFTQPVRTYGGLTMGLLWKFE